MRIISQNGYDFPYEKIVVILDRNSVICRTISDMNRRYYFLGQYDTDERAKEVFIELHDYVIYEREQKMFFMPDN